MKQLSLQFIYIFFLSCLLYIYIYVCVVHTVELLHVNWFQCSSTKSLSGMVQPQYAWKMRNSPLSSHLPQTFSTKCSKRSHYTIEVKIFAFITHLFEHTGHISSQKNAQCVAITVLLCMSSFPNNLPAAIKPILVVITVLCELFRRGVNVLKRLKNKSLHYKMYYIRTVCECVCVYIYTSLMIAHTSWK